MKKLKESKDDWYVQLESMSVEEFMKEAISASNAFSQHLTGSSNLIQTVQQTWALQDLKALCNLTKKRIGAKNELYLSICSNLGIALGTAGEYEEAKKLLRSSARLALSLKNVKPNECARVHHELGLVLSQNGDIAAAIKAFKSSLSVKLSISSLYELGYAYAKIGSLDEAETAFREVTLKSRSKADYHITMLAYRQIFVICRHDGRLEEGLSALKNAIRFAKKLGDKDRLHQFSSDLDECEA